MEQQPPINIANEANNMTSQINVFVNQTDNTLNYDEQVISPISSDLIPNSNNSSSESVNQSDNTLNRGGGYFRVYNGYEREFFEMINTLIENRTHTLAPIRFMTEMSNFVIDPDTATFRVPYSRNIRNDGNIIYEFHNEFDCGYCDDIIHNNLNDYLRHIVNNNHIQEQINSNNYLRNLNQDQVQYENERINQDQVQNESFDVSLDDIVTFLDFLTEDAMIPINNTLNDIGYENFDSEYQDLNDSQEYKRNLLEIVQDIYGNPIIIPMTHLNNRINDNININTINNNLLRTINELSQVNGVNRFVEPVPMPINNNDYNNNDGNDSYDDDDDDNDQYNPIRRNGLELSEHSTEYEIKVDTYCNICLETHKAIDKHKYNILLCMHQNCHDCTKNWFKKNVVCPTCKIDLRQLRAINLSEIGFGTF
jgi:hypothetical protein